MSAVITIISKILGQTPGKLNLEELQPPFSRIRPRVLGGGLHRCWLKISCGDALPSGGRPVEIIMVLWLPDSKTICDFPGAWAGFL